MPELSRGWPAPAKLNLMLHIVGRRDDGYHLLQTVFQFLDHGDELAFRVRTDGVIRRLGEVTGVAEEQDLTVRAARLLQRESGSPLGAEIAIDKRLPMGGGLGGGSSDAATVLVALNRLWGLGLTTERLAALGLALGADVPVFVHGRACWAEGVGEAVTPLDLPEPWYAVIHPGVHVSTAEIFSAPDLTRNSPRIKIRDFLASGGASGVANDCQAAVERRYPQVREAHAWLERFGAARLTGTGACLFAPFAEERAAREVIAALPGHWKGFAARGLNHSPLRARLAAEG